MEVDIAALRKTFLEDADDHVSAMEDALAQLEKNGSDKDSINALFGSVHSLKGDSGAVGFTDITNLLHHFETLLEDMRSGNKEVTEDVVDMMGNVVDQVEKLIDVAKSDGPIPDGYIETFTLLETLSSAVGSETGDLDFGLFEEEPESSCIEDDVELEWSQSFGGFLVVRERLTSEQLMTVLDHQRAERPLLGKMLVESGKISSCQATRILTYLNENQGRFGDVAVQLGFLDQETLDATFSEQKKLRPGLRYIMCELGYLDKVSIDAEFDEYCFRFPDAAQAESDVLEEQAPPPKSPSQEAFDTDSELLGEFIAESFEHLDEAEDQLMVIENEVGNTEALNAIYRAFHTIKGVASFLGLEDTRHLAHQAESMLNLARDGKLDLHGDALEVAFASVDGLKRQIGFAQQWLEVQGVLQHDPDLSILLAAIEAVSTGKKPASIPARIEEDESTAEPATPAPSAGKVPATGSQNRGATHLKESIKVDRDRLDKLINVIGELVIGQAMVEEEVSEWQAAIGHESLAMSQVRKTVRDLQELSLSLRMVPVSTAFHKMARIVRDLGRKLGKEIQFETEGEDTELDKTVVDQIGDPLLHMIRNAADHGIESPEERVAAGKSPQGRVILRAYHQGGNIYVEIEDDGKGLDREVLLAKAIERGIVSEKDTLSEQEINNLIFAAGFSTAKQVTDVSGRGVGMDVVRRNVESLQGSVSINSEKGQGSTVVIRLPLTLAILDGLSILVGEEVYIIPILSVVESFSPEIADIKRVAGRGEVVLVRGEVVPLLRLSKLLQVHGTSPALEGPPSLVVIVEDQGKKFAMVVDELLGQSQVVIKNLEANYKKVDGVAGATILGDGRIAMILDVYGLVCLASTPSRVLSEGPHFLPSGENEIEPSPELDTEFAAN